MLSVVDKPYVPKHMKTKCIKRYTGKRANVKGGKSHGSKKLLG